MKKSSKFFACLFIILIAAATAFYFGFSPLHIQDDSVGVLVSKTSGVSSVPIEKGKFRFDWQLLIPTNSKIRQFSAKPFSASEKKSGILPSGDIYARLLKENSDLQNQDFSYSFDFDIELKFDSTEFVNLVKDSDIASDSDVNEKYRLIKEEIFSKTINYIFAELSLISDTNSAFNTNSIFEKVIDKIKNEYSSRVKIISFNITKSKLPDVVLYNTTKKMYLDYMAEVNQKLLSLSENQAREISEYTKNLNKLEKFGKVLKENPVLADFLKSSKDMNETLKTIYSFN